MKVYVVLEEDAAYHQWLQRETERFDAEQIERFFEILEQENMQ